MSEFIEGGTVMGTYDSLTGFTPNPHYPEAIKNKTQKKIEESTVSHADLSHSSSAGFKSPRKIEEVDERAEQQNREETLERLTLLKNQRTRILKDLERVNSVIKSIEADLSI